VRPASRGGGELSPAPFLARNPGSLFYTTCNRVEVLCVTDAVETRPGVFSSFFARHPEVAPEALAKSLYFYRDEEAVRHFFRVAASLDALVVGEPQILGQVKEAYRQATKHKATGAILNRLMHKTFSVAKRVRTETGHRRPRGQRQLCRGGPGEKNLWGP
jgi:glutamyl-tRNA reductase